MAKKAGSGKSMWAQARAEVRNNPHHAELRDARTTRDIAVTFKSPSSAHRAQKKLDAVESKFNAAMQASPNALVKHAEAKTEKHHAAGTKQNEAHGDGHRGNPYHLPGGSPHGGEFTSAPAGGGKKSLFKGK